MSGKARRGSDFDIRLLDGRRTRMFYDVRDDEAGQRLDQFLAGRLVWRSRSSARKLLDEGLVELDDRSARPSRKVRAGERVVVHLPRPMRDRSLLGKLGQGEPETDPELPRLFEDEHLIAIDKPADLPVHPSGRLLHFTVITALHRQYRDFDDPERDVIPKLCHRLDLETSGVLLVAKTHQALVHVQSQFERRTVEKEYLALVHGRVEPDEGLIDLPIGPAHDPTVRHRRAIRHDVGLPSRTRYRVARRWAEHTLLHIHLLTGRHHQIRVHVSSMGHPVVGDKIYGRDEGIFERYGEGTITADDRRVLEVPRQALHSHALAFDHPVAGRMRVVSPWPPDLAAYTERLGPDAS
ncbi:MAG: RluA family pseudouridine synthase [Planctomycetes bacterium]|nr:RluA family pseudouridine synthase [Planctomycetota bacterium]